MNRSSWNHFWDVLVAYAVETFTPKLIDGEEQKHMFLLQGPRFFLQLY